MARKITARTWVVVADGAHAKVYTGDADGRGLSAAPVSTYDATTKRNRELVTDKPGRLWGPGPRGGAPNVGQRSAADPRTEPRRHVEQMFIKDVADAVESAVKDGAVDQLVLVAAPRALGDLRNALSDYVKAKVIAEIDRELVQRPPAEILDHVREALQPQR